MPVLLPGTITQQGDLFEFRITVFPADTHGHNDYMRKEDQVRKPSSRPKRSGACRALGICSCSPTMLRILPKSININGNEAHVFARSYHIGSNLVAEKGA